MGGRELDEYLSVMTLELGRLALGDLEACIPADAQLRSAATLREQANMPVERRSQPMG